MKKNNPVFDRFNTHRLFTFVWTSEKYTFLEKIHFFVFVGVFLTIIFYVLGGEILYVLGIKLPGFFWVMGGVIILLLFPPTFKMIKTSTENTINYIKIKFSIPFFRSLGVSKKEIERQLDYVKILTQDSPDDNSEYLKARIIYDGKVLIFELYALIISFAIVIVMARAYRWEENYIFIALVLNILLIRGFGGGFWMRRISDLYWSIKNFFDFNN